MFFFIKKLLYNKIKIYWRVGRQVFPASFGGRKNDCNRHGGWDIIAYHNWNYKLHIESNTIPISSWLLTIQFVLLFASRRIKPQIILCGTILALIHNQLMTLTLTVLVSATPTVYRLSSLFRWMLQLYILDPHSNPQIKPVCGPSAYHNTCMVCLGHNAACTCESIPWVG